MSRLKKIRLAIALAIFVLFLMAFSGIPAITPGWAVLETITSLQLIPSILRFTALLGVAAIGFILIFILTALFGRVYCSFLCPLGILQDAISRIAKRFKKRKVFRFAKAHNILRYCVLAIVVMSLLTGSVFLLSLLDPYSIFGKISSNLFRPILILINDSLSKGFELFGLYWVNPVGIKGIFLPAIAISLGFFVAIAILASLHGRLFCNTICPVGSLLSLVSKFSFFRVKINETNCTRCGKCSTVCKSECIDIKSKEVDFTRCVACFNCISVCPEKGIGYEKANFKNAKISDASNSRKEFLAKSLLLIGGTTLLTWQAKAQSQNKEGSKSGKYSFKRLRPITPPGSYSSENFTKHCTGCQLCVTTCPTQVLQPSFKQYGWSGVMLPHLDYSTSFCNYECTKCSEVCPNGAILPINSEQKKNIQTGKVVFLKENCVVFADETSCGACSEHCPTKAVHMVPYKGTLTIPETDVNICVGCGGCEYACPAKPFKAIYVEGNAVHQLAFRPKEEKTKTGVPEEFPF